jgi:hypothetical protein
MHYAPTQNELSFLDGATLAERLDYFLTRCIEAEEVWSIRNGLGWATKELDGISVLPVWPYAELASTCVKGSNTPDAVSLEHFIYNLLPSMIEQEIQIEILPTGAQQGLVMEAQALFEIIERKLDAGEYFLEG